MFYCCYTHVLYSKGLTSIVANARNNICRPGHCTQMCSHPPQTIRQHTARRTHPSLKTQQSEHSCPNCGTSNTTIVGGPEKEAGRCVVDAELTLLDSWYVPDQAPYSPSSTPPPLLSVTQSTSSSLFCSRHGPLLSHISSPNSPGKTSLKLTLHMWVHTAKSSNNTEILQIRSRQKINGGISGAHPSLRRGRLEAWPDLHVKIHTMIHTVP